MVNLEVRLPQSDFLEHMGAAAAALLGRRGCMFTFHRGAHTGAWEQLPNRDFHIDLGYLDRLLGYLIRTGWTIVTIDDVLARLSRGETDDRFVNFSIDDCYCDTFHDVVPVFRKHRVPVTLFVTTGIPDGVGPMWYVGLEDVIHERASIAVEGRVIGTTTQEQKRAAFRSVAAAWERGEVTAAYAAFCRENAVDADAIYRKHALTWDMLDALSRDPLVEIGSHTISHARFAATTAGEAMTELVGSRDRLRTKLGVVARHFAFPYGREADCGPRDFALVREAGFASAATTRKGLVRRGQDPFCLPRNTLNGSHRSLVSAELHLTGLTGAAARVLRRV